MAAFLAWSQHSWGESPELSFFLGVFLNVSPLFYPEFTYLLLYFCLLLRELLLKSLLILSRAPLLQFTSFSSAFPRDSLLDLT